MEDFRFIGYFFIGFAVLIFIAIMIGLSNKAEEKQQRDQVAQEKFSNSMNGFLTEFDPAKARNIRYVDTLYQSGDNPYAKEYIRGARDKEEVTSTNQFINQTAYDIIVLSYDELVLAYGRKPYRFLLKSGDTVQGKHDKGYKQKQQRWLFIN